ncbi:chromosomal replication initiator protein DnaA [Tautonia plasticadhaerens]|uniref:Chromosomal replication initiator protein DnaA n=1 Tax=Tautonia plasticadhaerens TaxID=2527974 RepID=A0A518GUB0_9BACT|nr:chromosomal replication initiator protein DnaA [Tautonia plasticadhaerens]QDV32178.1 Chromosomal replication initiator protein DnaA [Tautonia plasticadhaerens]
MTDRRFEMESALRAAVAERVGESRFGLWFGDGVRLGVDGDALTVGVPNRFFRDWIKGKYAGELASVGEAVSGRRLELAFEVADELEPGVDEVSPSPEGPPPDDRRRGPTVPIALPSSPGGWPSPSPSPGPPVDRPRSRRGRPLRRLEEFVAGPGTRLALAACGEMAEAVGATFNPLVVHGGVGLGKTHLLEGVAQAVSRRHPGARVVHQTAEAFTNGFLESMRSGTLNAFRSRSRSADVLILDDVHFLAAKRATQDEFQHAFDALVSSGAAVVLASDQHPRLIPKLTDELATRLLGGMVVKLEAPDPTTRRAILKAKAASRGVDLPDAVAAYIADHLRASVRELEGALHSVLAHAGLTGKRLDLDLARSALRDTIRHTAQAIALKDIERAVSTLFDLPAEGLKSDSRARAVTHPRMLAMYLARKHTGAAYSEIGRYFGGRNHSTVISAEKKVRCWLADEQRQSLLAGFETVGDVLAAVERSLGT